MRLYVGNQALGALVLLGLVKLEVHHLGAEIVNAEFAYLRLLHLQFLWRNHLEVERLGSSRLVLKSNSVALVRAEAQLPRVPEQVAPLQVEDAQLVLLLGVHDLIGCHRLEDEKIVALLVLLKYTSAVKQSGWVEGRGLINLELRIGPEVHLLKKHAASADVCQRQLEAEFVLDRNDFLLDVQRPGCLKLVLLLLGLYHLFGLDINIVVHCVQVPSFDLAVTTCRQHLVELFYEARRRVVHVHSHHVRERLGVFNLKVQGEGHTSSRGQLLDPFIQQFDLTGGARSLALLGDAHAQLELVYFLVA